MNEQAILDSYNLFVQNGYKKSIDEFKKLISSNPQALDDSFNLFVQNGYKKSIKDYSSLMGLTQATELQPVKKKEQESLPTEDMVSPLEGGSLESQKTEDFLFKPQYGKPQPAIEQPVPEEPTETVAVGPIGMTGLQRTKDYKPDEKQGWLLNVVSSIDKGAYNLPGEAVKGVGTLLEGVTGKGFVSDALKKVGTSYLKAIEELTPQDAEFKNTLTDQFGQAFGQVAGMVLTSGVSQVGKGATALSAAEAALASQTAPKALTVGGAVKKLASDISNPAAASMGLAMGQGEFERAKAAGATDDQAFEAFYKNAVVGSVLENIPVMHFLKRFNKASAGGVVNYLKTKAIGGLTGGAEEMTTEVLQQLYANQTAQDIYNINQDLFEGVGESGGIGFGVGFLLNAMGANAKLLRKEGKNDEAEVVENQIKEFENAPQAPAGPPPTYSVAGVKITDPVVINDMIDKMDVADLVNSNIEITNDPELNTRLQDKIVTSSIKQQVSESNPNLSEEQLDEVTNLEKELRKFEGNTTQSGKNKAAAIRSQIKTIQDAVQEQSTDESVLRTEEPQVELQQVGEGNIQPEVTTEGTQEVTVPAVNEEEVSSLVIDSNERTSWTKNNKEYKVGDIIDGNQLDELSGNLVGNVPNEKFILVQVPLSEFTDTREELMSLESDYQNEEIDRLENMKSNFDKTPPIPPEGDGMHRIIAAKELGNNTILMWKNIKDVQQPTVSSKTQEEVAPALTRDELPNYQQDTKTEATKKILDYFAEVLGIPKFSEDLSKRTYASWLNNTWVDGTPAFGHAVSDKLFYPKKAFDIITKYKKELDKQAKAAEAARIIEAAPVEEVEQYVPILPKQITNEKFTRDNAIDYEEGERETDSGRTVTYLASLTVEAQDDNGDTVGSLTKITDEDGIVSWNAADVDGNELSFDGFDSKDEAKQALVNKVNKDRKKEFDKEAKKKAKAKEKKSKFAKDETVRPQPTGDRTGRTEGSTITPLEGSPSVPGVNGPDPQLIAVAEQYAKENGIPFSRQAEYVKVDEDRAKRLADAYEEMVNDPKNPKVKEAYQNLIKQTIAQYEALVKAGYKFWFMDLNIPSNAEYASTPYNAIRDLRNNKEMGVFATTDGYGDSGLTELDVENNPLLADTGIQWGVGGLDGPKKNVLANDLFRAVHDAFGHGLEGSGFRARGEENAWQAHVRLFNGSAIEALTSETRGQNSWLNYGPNGEKNRTAKVEDTVFAEQKVGLMPEWASKEGRAEDMKPAKAKQAKKIYETLPTKGVQPESGVVRPATKATTKPTGPAVPSRISSKREEVKSSIQRIANAGLLRSAETGKPAITEQEIDAQMALTDAMAKVWEETTGKNDFYDVFIEDVKEGDVDAIAKKGGALFQNVELPQRPITRVSLGVFELPEFQKMKGMSVAPQSISDLMKSRGKQIEKDIVNTVLSYDKYRGQKRISFDEFRDDVETQLMKLERIDTKTYASYGMDNLGGNHTYGESQTIIFNSPIDHGQYGHFRSDFTKGNLAVKTWEIKQIPNTEQYVAIDSDMPSGTPANEMSSYVGTAGPRVDVEKWINDRNSITDKEINKGLFGHIRNWFNRNTGVYTLAELQSDYFQKNKANDLYASKISQDEVNEYVNKNFRKKLDNDTTEAIKKEFGIVVDYTTNANSDTIATATIKNNPNIPSDYVLAQNRYSASYVPVPGFTLEDVSENQTVVEALRSLAVGNKVFNDTKVFNTDLAARRREIMAEYEAKRLEIKKEENKYIASRIEEIKKSDSGNLMVSQFIASQKVHELRLFREALKHAADKGATDLWFPTPYTIAKIEGYVSNTGNAPYEIVTGDENVLAPGDEINYGETNMTVVESNRFSITVAPSEEVSRYDVDELRDGEIDYRMGELEYDLERQVNDINSITKEETESYNTDDFLSEEILTQLKDYFENNPEEEFVSWSNIESKVRTYVEEYYNSASIEELIPSAGDIYWEGDYVYAVENRRSVERLSQPSEYESTTNEDDFEDNLSDEQSTVVKKYDELGKMIKKMRPDAELVADDDGNKWIKTAITNADATNPIIAFQEEGGKIKGAIDFSNDNKASIYIFDGADISTLAHEISGHLGRRFLEKLADTNTAFAKDYETAKKWAGVKDNQWSRAAEEKWARGFEKYLRTGKAPSKALTSVFQKFRTWLTNIYKTIKGSSIDVKLTPEIISVFDNLLATKAETKTTVAPAVEEGPTAEDLASIDAMLDLDMEDEDNMLSVLNALDRVDSAITKRLRGNANDALLAIPLSTVQLVVKTLKTLVKGGMMLRDAIKKVAADNNLSQDSVKDILNIAPIQDGFNALMDKVGAMVKRQTSRGTEAKKMVSNVDTLVRNSEVYQNANDAQKKILEREARTQAGARERRAPSIGRILGALKDITDVSRKDKLKIISEIRKLSKDAAKDLANEIKVLADTGKITVKQAANIVSRFGKVNMLSEISVSKFVDYMTKVFADAEYVQKISDVKSKLGAAKKNIASKIGIADGLMVPLQKLLSVNPTLIPDKYFDRYAELVNMFGARKAVLTLEDKQKVTKDVNEILDAINAEQSQVIELADRMKSSENKVEEDGKLDYSKTVKSMLENKEIDEKEADVMMKYQEEISEDVEPTKEEDKQSIISEINSSKINANDLPTKDERDLAKKLSKLIKSINLSRLSVSELNNLLKVIDNINNGYLPHYAELLVERINALDDSKVLDKAISTAKPLPFSNLYARFKSLFTKNKNFSELIRRNPLYYIDQVFGNFNTKEIFNSIFEKPAEAQAKFAFSEKQIAKKLKESELKVAKSFNMDANKTTMSKYKMMAYLLQREFQSNPNNKQVNPASKFLQATIDHIENGKSSFTDRDIEMLEKIQKDYSDANGEIDAEKLFNSFNSAEKSAIKEISNINNEMREKAVYTSSIIRGDKISPLTDYVHHYTLLDDRQQEDITGASALDNYSNTLRPSTKAKSLLSRTGKATPLNFDVFASAQRGAKFVLMDYYLTEPIRTSRKAINETSKLLKERKADKKQRDIFNAISDAFDESTENLLTQSFMSTSLADDVVDYLSKQGYRAVLASIPRFASELTSNVAFATIVAPKDFSTGIGMKSFIFSTDAPKAVFNLNSKQVNRLFPNHTLSGKMVDTSVLNDAIGVKGSRAKNDIANKIQQIYNLSIGKYVNSIELTADALISTPDKITMRPVWFGSFKNEFKNLTGNEPDFDKIANNDEAYMSENKENLDRATLVADKKSVLMGATDNAFMGILKGTTKPNQSGFIRSFNRFNNFMTTFLIYEYATARTGIMAAMKGGHISRKQGVALLGGVTSRMVLYTLMMNVLGSAMVGLFVDDDEEDEKSWLQKIGQSLTSAFSSMVLGRDFGNVTKTLVNYGVEKVNQEYLDFLREGEYDPYKDAIQYSVLPVDKQGKPEQILFNMMGPFSPSAKTAYLITKKALEKPKEEQEAIERTEKEKNVRIPLEFFGNLGMIPLYKDIHKIVNAELYKDLGKTNNTEGKGSSINKEDMKKYFPDMYNNLYGPNGSLYDVELMKKEIRREQEKIKKEIKDEMYR